jgi:hypothetical protein
LLLQASCDSAAQLWVNAELLKDRKEWAAGWLPMSEVGGGGAGGGGGGGGDGGDGEPGGGGAGQLCRACAGTGWRACQACDGTGAPQLIEL